MQKERTKEQRINQTTPIIKKLNELKISAAEHPEIRSLIQHIQTYILTGERIEINIPFPAADINIKGLLTPDLNERNWVKLTRDD